MDKKQPNKFLIFLADFIAGGLLAGVVICLFIVLFLPSCRILKAHKSETKQTVDSTHQLVQQVQGSTRMDSQVHQVKIDSAAANNRWQYEITTVVDETIDTGMSLHFGKPVKTKRTTTIEHGTVDEMETHVNTDHLNIDWSFLDTSSGSTQVNDQVKKTSTIKVSDKKVTHVAWWFAPGIILLTLAGIAVHLKPGQWQWILAFFKRKRKTDD
jgi:mannitol-specific phosphotransferase system IIBC component